jgi:hypothetical protein
MAIIKRIGTHTATVVLTNKDLVRLLGLLDYAIPEGSGGKYTKLVRGFDELKSLRATFEEAKAGIEGVERIDNGQEPLVPPDSLFTGARGISYSKIPWAPTSYEVQ